MFERKDYQEMIRWKNEFAPAYALFLNGFISLSLQFHYAANAFTQPLYGAFFAKNHKLIALRA